MSTQSQPQHHSSYQETLPVHFLRTRNSDNEECYFVIRCSQMNYTMLMAKKGRESVKVSDFAEILSSGYGHRPSSYTINKLKTNYDITLPDNL